MTHKQALELIEWLANNVEEIPEKQNNSDKLLVEIYKIAHTMRENKCCDGCHEDWAENAAKMYNENKKYFN